MLKNKRECKDDDVGSKIPKSSVINEEKSCLPLDVQASNLGTSGLWRLP